MAGVDDVRISLSCNTDLLEPFDFAVSSPGAIAKIENVTKGGCDVHLTYSSQQIFPLGKLGDIRCRTYVTDSFATALKLTDSTLITITPLCGDSILSRQIAGDLAIARIVSLNPNPTNGKVEIGLHYPEGFDEMCTLEIYDVTGVKTEERLVEISAKEKTSSLMLDLQGASGVRYIRLVSSKGVCTAKVFLAK
jgi:hypothetical protein